MRLLTKSIFISGVFAGLLMTQASANELNSSQFDKTDATLMIMLTQKYTKGCARWAKNKYPEKLEEGIDVNTRPRLAHASECIAKLSKRDPEYIAMVKKHAQVQSLKSRGFVEYDIQ